MLIDGELYLITDDNQELTLPILYNNRVHQNCLLGLLHMLVDNIFGEWININHFDGYGVIPLSAVYLNNCDTDDGNPIPVLDIQELKDGNIFDAVATIYTDITTGEVYTCIFEYYANNYSQQIEHRMQYYDTRHNNTKNIFDIKIYSNGLKFYVGNTLVYGILDFPTWRNKLDTFLRGVNHK